ncbi:MAG: tryptophan synthase subunit beta [Deltaproteobacteria bacterium]|nr:tryptophan synthase subunit beta [Deltaproteobacteria bacterium]
MSHVSLPDAKGFFGAFGGRFVPEILAPAVDELNAAFQKARKDEAFRQDLAAVMRDFSGRPTPLTTAVRFAGAGQSFVLELKREDLNHTGAHKINNTLGQVMLAVRMGKSRIIAETGAGQHGVATATAAALFGLPCSVYMGVEDIRRQAPNVERMRLLGAGVIPVDKGSGTLKDAVNEAMRDWVRHVEDTFYVLGSAVGPHPYPLMVRYFQSVIGTEAREQFQKRYGELPYMLVACVGGGSNAAGLFYPFQRDAVLMVGVEAGGMGTGPGQHGASLGMGSPGIFHGSLSYVLQDDDGQIIPAHSVSAGLDYPGVGPEHSFWKQNGRVSYHSVSDEEALAATRRFTREEGILPALESAHALAWIFRNSEKLAGKKVLFCLSGRGDKDMEALLDERS